MTERPRVRDPETDPHIPADHISGIGIEDSERVTADRKADTPEQTLPKEELLDFLEGNPGGRPCPRPLSFPDPNI